MGFRGPQALDDNLGGNVYSLSNTMVENRGCRSLELSVNQLKTEQLIQNQLSRSDDRSNKEVHAIQEDASTLERSVAVLRCTGTIAFFFLRCAELADCQSVENRCFVEVLRCPVCSLRARLRVHLACERACCTISAKTFRVSP
jgi:hypothetical protein